MTDHDATTDPGPDRRRPAPKNLRDSLRTTARTLTVPQGFTLSVAGASIALIGQKGYPGLLSVWLFLLGAALSFGLCALISGAHRAVTSSAAPASGGAIFNLAPLVVVPLSAYAGGFIDDARLAFFACGAITVGGYAVAAATFFSALDKWAASKTIRRERIFRDVNR